MNERLTEAISLILGVILGLGWAMNLIKFLSLNFESPYRAEMIRLLGVITPLGTVIGYLHIVD